jgi:hypothetical protein
MSRRTFNDWKILVEKQVASRPSVPEFCQQHQLSAIYFNSRKSMVIKKTQPMAFVQTQMVTMKKHCLLLGR